VLRGLTPEALADWERLAETALFGRLTAEGKLVGSERVAEALDGYAAVLRHERIPFVSYPYEWSFGMLKDAALLQLELLLAALDDDLTLKDASPYNVQWRGARPVFIDVGSFEPLREGEPWAGYRQFCALFLYPLLLQAWKGVPYNPWLRGSLEGISPGELRGLLSPRDRFRRGTLTHVVLHSRLERRYGSRERNVRSELRSAGFHKGLIQANVRGLQKLVRRLSWEPEPTTWVEYGPTTSYSEGDAGRKAAFVREAASARHRRLVWDLGCNDGRFSRIAAEHADYAVGLDADPGVIEQLYRALKDEGSSTILPLVANLADPSPGLGWRGLERPPLPERGRPDLILCLALVHHLAAGANVPLASIVDWLRSLGGSLVVEFPTRRDPMVERLLAAKREGLHADYERDVFERLLREAFEVERLEELAGGTRILYLAHPRG
jgi:SAM-dependent methyltransferase